LHVIKYPRSGVDNISNICLKKVTKDRVVPGFSLNATEKKKLFRVQFLNSLAFKKRYLSKLVKIIFKRNLKTKDISNFLGRC